MILIDQLYGWQYNMRQQAVGLLYLARKWMPIRTTAEAGVGHILVVMTGLLGDTVMSTPLIAESRRLWPDARIVLLGRHHNCELLSACPLVDCIVEAPAVPFSLMKRSEDAQLKEWLRVQQFNLAIIALGDQFASVLADVGIPVRVGVRGHLLEPCLTHVYDIGSACLWGPSERLNALRCLGYNVQDVQPQLWVSGMSRGEVEERLLDHGISSGESYVVIHPFGSTRRQWWPIGNVPALADALWREHRLRSVLIGGPETRGQWPAGRVGTVVDCTGALSIPQLLALIDGARLVITTDSGPFHMAGALSRPLVGLFRARRPEHATRYPQTRVVFGQEETCERRCQWDRCRWEPCRQLAALPVRSVLETSATLLEGGTVPGGSAQSDDRHAARVAGELR